MKMKRQNKVLLAIVLACLAVLSVSCATKKEVYTGSGASTDRNVEISVGTYKQ
jgi:ABC-type cobalt transport system substrate-binding protein